MKTTLKTIFAGMRRTATSLAAAAILMPAALLAQPAKTNDSLEFYVAKGQKLWQARNVEESLTAFNRAATFDPNDIRVIRGQMGANFQLGKVDDGLKVLTAWTGREPKNPTAWFYLFMAQAETNHPAEALVSIDKLITLQPDTAVNYIGRGQVLSALGRNEEAVQSLDKAIKMNPKLEDAWSIKAGVLARMKRYDEALATMDGMSKLFKHSGNMLYNRACIYSLKGDKSKALADLQKAFELQPGLKEQAPKDEDLKALYDDEGFKKLTR